ncbi:Rrf2 family transcriptional regulator [Deferribacter autotrophicus]|uniref:Rrf2 family transcriptional regulator n=1 Tax=Deferribacter autotrophicus TaxID=500465 RepID=A0A5A8F3W7_9BACT|nr:Rrf2 family transcriptional regulator [Deferribacter autotrophicus]KAA0257184.1 Rrf2 family transcriptional regulator [Deferribacter autotrophicus]
MNATSKTIYAIIALIELARQKNELLKGATIAKKYGIPRRFLELTLSELKIHGLVDSKKGAHGGFLLVKQPEEISLYEIINITERDLVIFDCRKFINKDGCDMLRIFDELNEEILSILKKVTLRDILNKADKIYKNLNFII